MMDKIILTREKTEGKKLLNFLANFDENFTSLLLMTKDEIISLPHSCKDVTTIFSTWYMPSFTKEEIKQFFPSLKAIFYAGGTVKYFAIPFLESGIKIFSAASANGIPVAEYTAAQIILANKGYFQAQKEYHWPIWTRGFRKARRYSESKWGNYKAQVGIIGCGAIGSKVVEFLKPYKLEIMVYDPFISDERILELGVKRVSLSELFSSSDVITNHLPDIPETKGLINYSLLSQMKPTTTFINTGRGRQVIEKDLSKVLRKNPDICALLDVTTHEPLFPWSPLYWNRNVFLTPHIAGSLSNEYGRMVEFMIQAFHDAQNGKKNPCEVFLEDLNKKA